MLASAPALALLALHQALITRPYIDDSYIFYRYASNWGHGLGLGFNPHELVEGFSSFLWTALLALPASLDAAPQTVAPVLGVAIAAGALVLVASVALGPLKFPAWLAALSALGLAASPAFATYASSGMDTLLFAVVLLGAIAAASGYVEASRARSVSRKLGAATAASLVALTLTRAEGPVYALAIGAAAAVLGRPGPVARARLAGFAPLAVAAAATTTVVVVRELIYGTWVPATVMAKGYTGHLVGEAVSHPSQAANVWRAIRSGASYVGPLPFVLVALLLTAVWFERRRVQRLPVLPTLGLVAICLGIATAIWDTGDWMPYRRLLVPVLPLMVLLGSWAALSLARPLGARVALRGLTGAAAIAAAALAVLAAGLSAGPEAPQYEAQQLRAVGRLMATTARPLHLLTNLAGVLPYYAGSRVYVWDMLGLTDIHNARYGEIFSPQFGRTDPQYDFTRPFDLFVSNSSWDLALMTQALPQDPNRWLFFSNPRWAAIPLYVVARAGGPLPARLAGLCGCRPARLDPSLRRRLLADLAARGAFPPGLLVAARTHRPFPA